MNLVNKVLPLLAAGILVGGLTLAQTNSNSNTNSGTNSNRQINVACMQTAVTKREDAVSLAVGAYNTTLMSALTARKTALTSAWALTDRKARRKALMAAWKTFQNSEKSARKTQRDAKKSAWSQYRADRNACGPQHATQDVSGESGDSQL